MASGRDILVVEDEPVVVGSLKKILEPEGFTVDSVIDVEGAWRLFGQEHHRVILVDLMLPVASGFELIRRARREAPSVPVILITGYATAENAVKALQEGAFDFVPKPFAADELLGVVMRALGFSDRKRGVAPPPEKDYFFLGVHAWAKVEPDGTIVFGAGAGFVSEVEFRGVELPSLQSELVQGNEAVRLTSQGALVHRLWAPVGGTVLGVNLEVKENPDWIRLDPFGKGWLVRLLPSQLEDDLHHLSPRP